MQPVLAPRTTPARLAPWITGVLAATCIPLAVVLAFAWAPTAAITLDDAGRATQTDFPQKIFYIHVPVAFAAYLAFFTGAWNALLYLWREQPEHDVRSYAGIHVGMVFGTLVLVTGSIWARAAWGTWWQWGDRQLLVFLVLYLFYASYFMLRFSLAAGRYRARVSAVFALVGVALVPLSFLAIRIADTLIHPIVIERDGLNMGPEMAATFLVATVGFLALSLLMVQLESTAKIGTGWGMPTAAPADSDGEVRAAADAAPAITVREVVR